METTELKIDNMVLYDNETVKVVAIQKFTDTVFTHTLDEETMSEVPVSALAGIPITPEWLERAGFAQNEITKSIYDIPPHGFYSVKERGGNWYFLIDLEGGSVLTEIKYVHQLQNLYFALTGQELTFK